MWVDVAGIISAVIKLHITISHHVGFICVQRYCCNELASNHKYVLSMNSCLQIMRHKSAFFL